MNNGIASSNFNLRKSVDRVAERVKNALYAASLKFGTGNRDSGSN
ncbi:hypothetical protein [Candidatus Pelagisphaera phototrophica]|nr:hypothetical protein [Candidatus Pelagisphaera phototrophica]